MKHKKPKEMDDAELLGILDGQFNAAIGGYNSETDDDQADALDYYHGKPFGNELEGRSSVVTRDVLETIEWIMPSLLKIFASGNKTVEFDPVSLQDEKQADQETRVINHIFNKKNNGFLLLHNWFKDALLAKNGYIKPYVDEIEKVETETYSGLSDEQLAQVLDREDVEPIEHEMYEIMVPTPQGDMPAQVHDIKIKIKTIEKVIQFSVVPAEEIRVSRGHSELSLRDAPYVCHESIKTATDLIQMDIDKDVVDGLARDTGVENTLISHARHQNQEIDHDIRVETDDSMRPIRVREHYVYIDYNKTGEAELRKILTAGNVVLDNVEWDFIPFATLSPIIMPHEHTGVSEADLVQDIQLIRSVLLRQMLDNLYLTNNPEKEVLEDEVNMDDLLESLPGGIKRVKQMGSIREITVPFTAGQSMPMLDILDKMKEGRTGVSRHTMGLDADVLAKSTKGAFMGAMEQANQRIEMLARVFAETGVKELFQMTHELCVKNIDKPFVVKLSKEYIEIDPTSWRNRTDMTVTVGLGTGDKSRLVANLWQLAQRQEEHLKMGSPLVSPANLFNTYDKILESSEISDTSRYFTDPATIPPKPPQPPAPNPLAEAEKIKGEFKLRSEQMAAQFKMQLKQIEEANKNELARQKEESDNQMAMLKLQIENNKADKDRESREIIEAAKLEISAMIEGYKVDLGQPGIGAGLNE